MQATKKPIIKPEPTEVLTDERKNKPGSQIAEIFSPKPVLSTSELTEMGYGSLAEIGHLYGIKMIKLYKNRRVSGTGLNHLFTGGMRSGRYFFFNVDDAIEYFGSRIKEPVTPQTAGILKRTFMEAGFDEMESESIVSKKYTFSKEHLIRVNQRIKRRLLRNEQNLKDIGIILPKKQN